jgi:branched-chain amino acid transport system permease protein
MLYAWRALARHALAGFAMMDILTLGLMISGTYALIAMGLNLQYGVARIMNLANGELLILGALASFWFYSYKGVSPYVTILFLAPISFVGSWLIYRILMMPLVRRSRTRAQLEVDTILASFGLSFIFIGLMTTADGGFFAYQYLSDPVSIFGSTTTQNRLVAFAVASVIAAALYLWLYKSRAGIAVRAVSVSTEASGLVGINVPRASALAFALGGAITAVGGALISTFITLSASMGVIFTMKALIIIIMGGVGDTRGVIVGALVLGFVETAVATLIDPGLTLAAAYFIFSLVLLFRPQGIFGRPAT